MFKKTLIISIIFSILFIFSASSENEVFIKFKVDNEIITNIDLVNEKNYLIALNNKLSSVSSKELNELSKNSLIKEKIKIKELNKFFDLEKVKTFGEKITKNFYENIGIKNKEDFEIYLKNFNLEYEEVKRKLTIEAMWNRLIYKKYNDKININEDKLKKSLSDKIKNSPQKMVEYNLSEIVFELNSNEEIKKKYKLIQNNINKYGFKETASLISISGTASSGGDVGWIKKTHLSNKIIQNLQLISIGQYTEPIQVNNAFLILKINDIRKIEKNINFEKEFEKLLMIEKNRQLNNFSIIHFNKIKKNINISEI
jgi:peptidyl-prolyl cis-trans isomerase SurA